MKNIYKRTIEGCGFLTPLQQYFRYIVMISVTGGENRNPPENTIELPRIFWLRVYLMKVITETRRSYYLISMFLLLANFNT
jgi:hypothetical protein